jgi:hypothetical protein
MCVYCSGVEIILDKAKLRDRRMGEGAVSVHTSERSTSEFPAACVCYMRCLPRITIL